MGYLGIDEKNMLNVTRLSHAHWGCNIMPFLFCSIRWCYISIATYILVNIQDFAQTFKQPIIAGESTASPESCSRSERKYMTTRKWFFCGTLTNRSLCTDLVQELR